MRLDAGLTIVTGGAGGIGAAVVAALEQLGTAAAAVDRVPNPAAAISVTADVTDDAEMGAAMRALDAAHGPIRGLVCAAGVVSEAPLTELAVEEFRRVVDVSLLGTFLSVRHTLPSMISTGGGSIVTFSSGLARRGYRNGAHYAAAKAAVEGLTRSVALEAAPSVRVNSVAPGPVETSMVDHIGPDRRAATSALIPLGRFAVIEEIVAPVLFLLSDDAAQITGQVIQINGGLVMG